MSPSGRTLAESVMENLRSSGPVAVAVSGGVDSLTLAHLAHHALPGTATMFHSVSAAVPGEATRRVRNHSERYGWSLVEIDSGEMSDERYLANPVDRCFHCKTDLYSTIRSMTTDTIVSGTNLDDLSDYRPGLVAAADHDVSHPFVDAGVDKTAVRAIARHLGLGDISELPAAPCLASRIETGLRVTSRRLSTAEQVETLVRSEFAAANVRCRLRSDSVAVEIDEELVAVAEETLGEAVRSLIDSLEFRTSVSFEPYRRGSAFIRDGSQTGEGRP